MSIHEKLKELNIELPTPATPLASYIPVKQSGNLLYVSGQLPTKNGELLYIGKLGKEITTEDGSNAARQCAINTLSAINAYIDLDKVKSIVKLMVFVNSTEDYTDAPSVANGASELFVQVFGNTIGQHTRSAVSVASLPKGVPVEIDIIVEI